MNKNQTIDFFFPFSFYLSPWSMPPKIAVSGLLKRNFANNVQKKIYHFLAKALRPNSKITIHHALHIFIVYTMAYSEKKNYTKNFNALKFPREFETFFRFLRTKFLQNKINQHSIAHTIQV